MQKRSMLFCLIGVILFVLCGCTNYQKPMETGEVVSETVSNVFTFPDQNMQITDATEPSSQMTIEQWQSVSMGSKSLTLGFCDYTPKNDITYYTYSGGEASVNITMTAEGMEKVGVGIFLFLDGQIQPYRTEEETEYSYMHTFYPENSKEYIIPLYLIPVTGESGEILEMQVMSVIWPDYFLDKGRTSIQHTSGTTGSATTLIFEDTPPAMEMPEVRERLLSCKLSYVELLSSEIAGWTAEDMRNKYEYHYYFDGIEDGASIFDYGASDTAIFRYEIWGNTAGKFGFVIFVDNQPVTIEPEKLISIETQNGMKTVIEAQLDMSDFDGSSVVYAVLIARNYFADGVGNGAYEIFRETIWPYYLSDSKDFYDLMGWVK